MLAIKFVKVELTWAMNRMKLLVGLLIIMLLGGIWGAGEWNWNLFADSQRTDTDSVMISIPSDRSVYSDGECLEEDCDTTLFAEYVSPIIPATKKPLKSFYRFKKKRHADFSSRFHYNLSVDFPQPSVKNNHAIRAWLAEKVVRSLSDDMTYNGNIYSDQQIEKYVINLYFAIKKEEYAAEDTTYYPIEAFIELNLQARVSNNKFVTYQEFTHEYDGGVHGYYTERLVSFDHVHKQEIDNKYLFKDNSFDSIVNLLVDEAKKTPHYWEWKPNIRKHIFVTDEQDNPTGEIRLPQPGLSAEGLVYSFQPYEISCFAAGTFHFVIPYERLKPYLTDKAKWCLNIK